MVQRHNNFSAVDRLSGRRDGVRRRRRRGELDHREPVRRWVVSVMSIAGKWYSLLGMMDYYYVCMHVLSLKIQGEIEIKNEIKVTKNISGI